MFPGVLRTYFLSSFWPLLFHLFPGSLDPDCFSCYTCFGGPWLIYLFPGILGTYFLSSLWPWLFTCFLDPWDLAYLTCFRDFWGPIFCHFLTLTLSPVSWILETLIIWAVSWNSEDLFEVNFLNMTFHMFPESRGPWLFYLFNMFAGDTDYLSCILMTYSMSSVWLWLFVRQVVQIQELYLGEFNQITGRTSLRRLTDVRVILCNLRSHLDGSLEVWKTRLVYVRVWDLHCLAPQNWLSKTREFFRIVAPCVCLSHLLFPFRFCLLHSRGMRILTRRAWEAKYLPVRVFL